MRIEVAHNKYIDQAISSIFLVAHKWILYRRRSRYGGLPNLKSSSLVDWGRSKIQKAQYNLYLAFWISEDAIKTKVSLK
jgi:hypothetical protein